MEGKPNLLATKKSNKPKLYSASVTSYSWEAKKQKISSSKSSKKMITQILLNKSIPFSRVTNHNIGIKYWSRICMEVASSIECLSRFYIRQISILKKNRSSEETKRPSSCTFSSNTEKTSSKVSFTKSKESKCTMSSFKWYQNPIRLIFKDCLERLLKWVNSTKFTTISLPK